MDTAVRIFSPADLTDIFSTPPELIRSWRARGYIRNYGLENHNGRWTYDIRDVVAFWMALRLSERGHSIQLQQALPVCWTDAPSVMSFIVRESKGLDHVGDRFVAFVEKNEIAKETGLNLYSSEVVKVSSLVDLENCEFDTLQVIDLLHLAKAAPPEIKRWVLDEMEAE